MQVSIVLEKGVCKLTEYVSKFHISSQILQGNALLSGKNYTIENNFTRPHVATVATNFKSAIMYHHRCHRRHHGHHQGLEVALRWSVNKRALSDCPSLYRTGRPTCVHFYAG